MTAPQTRALNRAPTDGSWVTSERRLSVASTMPDLIEEQRECGVKKLKILDLFSGIGGFSLGLERTGGFETVAFCEIEPFPRRVLAKHWPEVPCYDDVRTLTADRLAADGIPVDVICGGFPCQDLSFVGKRAGLSGKRSGLWSEVARLVGELQPQFLIVENVPALLGSGMGVVIGDLAEIGYDAEWDCVPASYVGANHIRDRIWIVGYPNATKDHRSPNKEIFTKKTMPRGNSEGLWGEAKPRISGVYNGISSRLDRLAALGNAVVPQIPEMIGRAILASVAP